jgi:transaldolase
MKLEDLRIKVFADGADKNGLLELNRNPLVRGMTTNPTLMRKAGIADYESFAREVLETIRDKPISFEVFADDFPEMRRQALKIKSWQDNVYVKIPITPRAGSSRRS